MLVRLYDLRDERLHLIKCKAFSLSTNFVHFSVKNYEVCQNYLTVIPGVGRIVICQSVNEAEGLRLEVEAADGSVVTGRNKFVLVEGVERQAVDRTCVRLKLK